MDTTRHRILCSAVAALLLGCGSTAAVAASAGQSMPEWQVHDDLDVRYGPLAWLTFDELVGSEVVDEQGRTVGDIVAVVRDRSDGMFYTVMDTQAPADEGDQVVAVDQLEVVGDSEQDRQIVLVGEPPADFDETQFEPASPQQTQAQG